MKLLIDLDEEYVKAIDKIKFLVGGRTDRKLQLEIIKAIKNGVPLEQEPSRDMEEIEEVIKCDADAETKCKMISNILTAKLHYFEEPTTKIEESNFSQEQYLADIQSAYDCGKSVIDKIRAEMLEEMLSHSGTGEEVIQAYADGLKKGLDLIDKYKGESEEK